MTRTTRLLARYIWTRQPTNGSPPPRYLTCRNGKFRTRRQRHKQRTSADDISDRGTAGRSSASKSSAMDRGRSMSFAPWRRLSWSARPKPPPVESRTTQAMAAQPALLKTGCNSSDVEAECVQLLTTVVGNLLRAPWRYPYPVDPVRFDQSLQGGRGLVLDNIS